MDSDNNQETDHKTSQKTRKTSLLLQTNTGGRKNEHPNLSNIKWKLRSSNRSPNGNPTKLWLIILGHKQNQKLIPLPRRQRNYSQHNSKRIPLPSLTDRGRNTKIGPIRYASKGKPQIIKDVPEHSRYGKAVDK